MGTFLLGVTLLTLVQRKTNMKSTISGSPLFCHKPKTSHDHRNLMRAMLTNQETDIWDIERGEKQSAQEGTRNFIGKAIVGGAHQANNCAHGDPYQQENIQEAPPPYSVPLHPQKDKYWKGPSFGGSQGFGNTWRLSLPSQIRGKPPSQRIPNPFERIATGFPKSLRQTDGKESRDCL